MQKNRLRDSFRDSHPSITCDPWLRTAALGGSLHPVKIHQLPQNIFHGVVHTQLHPSCFSPSAPWSITPSSRTDLLELDLVSIYFCSSRPCSHPLSNPACILQGTRVPQQGHGSEDRGQSKEQPQPVHPVEETLGRRGLCPQAMCPPSPRSFPFLPLPSCKQPRVS